MIEIKGLRKSFQEHEALRGIDLSIGQGETVALIGPSGSGKSTLLRCMNLLEEPTGGSIRLDQTLIETGKITKRLRHEIRQQTAMVFQGYHLFSNKTALENITEALITVQKQSRDDAKRKGRALLEKVGLSDKEASYPSRLSGGQQQRIAIARALALEPKVILFDEPTSALDPELVEEVLQVIRAVAEERITMVIVTHELEFARDVADRVVLLVDGAIVEENLAEQFFFDPQQERTKQFLAKFRREPDYYI